MQFRRRLCLTLFAFAAVAATVQPAIAQQQPKPNIILIVSDDFGYGDSTPYGGGPGRGMPTPNLERMANEGMTFHLEEEEMRKRALLLAAVVTLAVVAPKAASALPTAAAGALRASAAAVSDVEKAQYYWAYTWPYYAYYQSYAYYGYYAPYVGYYNYYQTYGCYAFDRYCTYSYW